MVVFGLLAINLALLVWLRVSLPASIPEASELPTKPRVASVMRAVAPASPRLAATDPVAILIENARNELHAEPEAKALAVMRNNLTSQFAVLYRMLELDEAGLAQLESLLLTRHELEAKARAALLATGTIPSLDQLRGATNYATELVDAQIAATLGPDKTPLFASYLTRSGDYSALDSLSAKLSYTEQPLTADERRSLRSAIMESDDQTGFLERATHLLAPEQMRELLKTYEARDIRNLQARLQEAFSEPMASP